MGGRIRLTEPSAVSKRLDSEADALGADEPGLHLCNAEMKV